MAEENHDADVLVSDVRWRCVEYIITTPACLNNVVMGYPDNINNTIQVDDGCIYNTSCQ